MNRTSNCLNAAQETSRLVKGNGVKASEYTWELPAEKAGRERLR